MARRSARRFQSSGLKSGRSAASAMSARAGVRRERGACSTRALASHPVSVDRRAPSWSKASAKARGSFPPAPSRSMAVVHSARPGRSRGSEVAPARTTRRTSAMGTSPTRTRRTGMPLDSAARSGSGRRNAGTGPRAGGAVAARKSIAGSQLIGHLRHQLGRPGPGRPWAAMETTTRSGVEPSPSSDLQIAGLEGTEACEVLGHVVGIGGVEPVLVEEVGLAAESAHLLQPVQEARLAAVHHALHLRCRGRGLACARQLAVHRGQDLAQVVTGTGQHLDLELPAVGPRIVEGPDRLRDALLVDQGAIEARGLAGRQESASAMSAASAGW